MVFSSRPLALKTGTEHKASASTSQSQPVCQCIEPTCLTDKQRPDRTSHMRVVQSIDPLKHKFPEWKMQKECVGENVELVRFDRWRALLGKLAMALLCLWPCLMCGRECLLNKSLAQQEKGC
jgi:hypothetical protein